jgi:twitching motility protein PilI
MAEQSSLRDYQRGLAARLAHVQGARSASKLGLQVGTERWLIDLADAGEVITVPPIARVPLTHAWFSGVANIRGNLYSIVNFPAFLGEAPLIPTEQSRLVLIGDKYRVGSALLINGVLGLRDAAQLQLKNDATTDAAPWSKAEYVDRDGNAWKELDVPRLVQHADFLGVGV